MTYDLDTFHDDMQLVCRIMGQAFRVRALCNTVDEATDYMARHADAAVIAQIDGLIILASTREETTP